MLAVTFALIAALSYGVSDFYGAVATKRLGATAANFLGYGVGVVVIGIGALFVPGVWSADAVLFGGIAGVAVALGFLAFYRAMAQGPVSIIAPLIAVVYAAVPVGWSVARGSELSSLAWWGIGLGIVAVLALSIPPKSGAENDEERAAELAAGRGQGPSLTAIGLGVFAALAMGAASVSLDYAPKDSGINSALAESAVAVVVIGLVFAFTKRPVSNEPAKPALITAAWAGALQGVANAAFVLALMYGELALVGVLVALYPLATILLARFVLKEHVSRVQWTGVGLAVVAAVLLGSA